MKKGNKNRRNIQKNEIINDNDNLLMSLFKIIGVLVLLFALFYGITVWRTNKKNLDNGDDTTEVAIQYDEIIIGTLLKQKEKEYYVLVADINGLDYSKYSVYVSMFDSEKPKIYTSDIKNIFNASYVGDNGNVSTYVGKSSITGIIFDDVTLLHLKETVNKKKEKVVKIAEAFVGENNVISAFKKIVS